MRLYAIIALSLVPILLTPVSAAEPSRDNVPNNFQSAITAAWEKTKIPGAVVAVIRPGQPTLTAVVGNADAEKHVPLTPECHFRIGSISKVFVGTAVLTLIDEEKISADDPISKYVDGVPNGDKITIRHLATHRAGLFNPIESRATKLRFAADPEKWWDEDELLAISLKVPAYFEPGTGYHYANVHTVLLAKVIEKATGRPWRDEVMARVIRPLGLKHTHIPTDNRLPKPFARGYAMGGEETPFFVRGDVRHDVTETSPSWWGAAGNMISTAEDLGKAAKPLATGALLKDKGKRELHAWTDTDWDGRQYGFHLDRVDDRIGHDGDVPGYQCAMYYLPKHDATVVGMGNLYGWSVRCMPTNSLVQAAIRHCFPENSPSQSKSSTESRRQRVEAGLRPLIQPRDQEQRWKLADRMAEYAVPGVSITVIEDGKVAWEKGYGVRDTDTQLPVDPQTRFQAGSISKFVTAILALRLADSGKLKLDTDINTILEDWKLPREDHWSDRPVTARQLLAHRGGVGTHGFIGYLAGSPIPSDVEILDGKKPANSTAIRVVAEPGMEEQYSGGGYQILQRIVQETSKSDFAQHATTDLFRPLGLKRTAFDQPATTDSNTASGHMGQRVLPGRALLYPELAAAGMWSTPHEIAELAMAVRKSWLGEQDSILRRSTAIDMLTAAQSPNSSRSRQGLGPQVVGSGRELWFGHAGGTIGFRSTFVLYPETGQGAVIMTNGSGEALIGEILRSIAAEYHWPGKDHRSQVRDTIRLSREELAKYAGNYAIEGNHTPYTVVVREDGLSLETPFKSPIHLVPTSRTTFIATSHDREVRFEWDAKNIKIEAATIWHREQMLFRIISR